MTTLDRDFEEKLREAVLDAAEPAAVELMENVVEVAHANLRAYASRHGYDVESSIESVTDVEVDRSAETVAVSVGWESGQMSRWEFGTSDHTVDGDPVLVFEFDGDEYPYLEEMFPEGTAYLPEVDVSGLPESRAIRDAMNGLRRVVQS